MDKDKWKKNYAISLPNKVLEEDAKIPLPQWTRPEGQANKIKYMYKNTPGVPFHPWTTYGKQSNKPQTPS